MWSMKTWDKSVVKLNVVESEVFKRYNLEFDVTDPYENILISGIKQAIKDYIRGMVVMDDISLFWKFKTMVGRYNRRKYFPSWVQSIYIENLRNFFSADEFLFDGEMDVLLAKADYDEEMGDIIRKGVFKCLSSVTEEVKRTLKDTTTLQELEKREKLREQKGRSFMTWHPKSSVN